MSEREEAYSKLLEELCEAEESDTYRRMLAASPYNQSYKEHGDD